MTTSEAGRRRLGGVGRVFLIAFLGLWLGLLWSYMAPLPAVPSGLNAQLVRLSCRINSVKIPESACDAEIEDAASGRVEPNGWWRFGGGLAGTGFAVFIYLQEVRRSAR